MQEPSPVHEQVDRLVAGIFSALDGTEPRAGAPTADAAGSLRRARALATDLLDALPEELHATMGTAQGEHPDGLTSAYFAAAQCARAIAKLPLEAGALGDARVHAHHLRDLIQRARGLQTLAVAQTDSFEVAGSVVEQSAALDHCAARRH